MSRTNMDETGEAEVLEIGATMAPWGKELVAQTLHFESGLRIVRLRIREGRRFTVLDVDAATARWIEMVFRAGLADDGAP